MESGMVDAMLTMAEGYNPKDVSTQLGAQSCSTAVVAVVDLLHWGVEVRDRLSRIQTTKRLYQLCSRWFFEFKGALPYHRRVVDACIAGLSILQEHSTMDQHMIKKEGGLDALQEKARTFYASQQSSAEQESAT